MHFPIPSESGQEGEQTMEAQKYPQIQWKKDTAIPMNLVEKNGVPFLTYPAFEKEEGIIHGFSTRLGGVSKGIWSSMNLSFTRGDRDEDVRENYRRMASALGIDVGQIVCSDQTHTVNVRVVTEEDKGKGLVSPRDYKDVDGLVTCVPGLVLATFYADCVPLFFIDTKKRAIGLSHSGWRGTVGKIGKVTVEKMQAAFGSRPEDILAAVGPSICRDCYEVSLDVAGQFAEVFPGAEEFGILMDKGGGKYLLDLWKANREVFLEAGILPEHISMPGICTCCNPQFLFSHRASGGKRGNLAAFLGLEKSNRLNA